MMSAGDGPLDTKNLQKHNVIMKTKVKQMGESIYSMARGHRKIENNVKSETESELWNLTQQGG